MNRCLPESLKPGKAIIKELLFEDGRMNRSPDLLITVHSSSVKPDQQFNLFSSVLGAETEEFTYLFEILTCNLSF